MHTSPHALCRDALYSDWRRHSAYSHERQRGWAMNFAGDTSHSRKAAVTSTTLGVARVIIISHKLDYRDAQKLREMVTEATQEK